MDEIHVAFGVHEQNGYHVHALTALYSLLARASSRVAVHILHDDTIKQKHKQLFLKLAARFDSEVIFHEVSALLKKLPATRGQDKFSAGCLFPLLIPETLPQIKALYLDCDVIVNTDVEKLLPFHKNDESSLWAVPEVHAFHPAFKNYLGALGIECAKYFNSGVLFFNNPVINARFQNFTHTAISVLETHWGLLYPDQDALNLLFCNEDVQSLPTRANFLMHYKNRAQQPAEKLENMIVHYAGKKPWKENFPSASLYWEERDRMEEFLKN